MFDKLSDEDIIEIMREFRECAHQWVPEPPESQFYEICSLCGGARGLRLPKDFLL